MPRRFPPRYWSGRQLATFSCITEMGYRSPGQRWTSTSRSQLLTGQNSILFLILRNYLNQENTKRLYAEAAHLLEADDFDYEAAGGWLAGHDAASGISACSAFPATLLDACEAVLSTQASPTGSLELVAETGADVMAGLRLLQSYLDGMRAGRYHGNGASRH